MGNSICEWLLSRIVGRDRASGIFGDLLEISANRGRATFWIAYLHMVSSLIWRTPAAIVVGRAIFALLYSLGAPLVFHPWRLHPFVGRLVMDYSLQLWFLVPFTAARYGWRDRLVWLASAASAIVSLSSLYVPLQSVGLVAAGVCALGALLISTRWRGSVMTLMGSLILGNLALSSLECLAHLGCWLYEHKQLNAASHYHFFDRGFAFPHDLFWTVMWVIAIVEMATLSITCTRIHDRSSGSSLTGASYV